MNTDEIKLLIAYALREGSPISVSDIDGESCKSLIKHGLIEPSKFGYGISAKGKQMVLSLTEVQVPDVKIGEKNLSDFDLAKCKQSEFYPKVWQLVMLLVEAHDALQAISLASARLHNVDFNLDKRIEDALEPWMVV